MSNTEHPLKTASLLVLENWAMMLVDEIVELKTELFDECEQLYMSQVNLRGPICGEVTILAQKNFMSSLARNVLGDDSESDTKWEDSQDAYREMGNVLAGNFITQAYGEDVVFDLLNPTISQVPLNSLAGIAERNIVFGFLADDSPIAITFNIKRE